MRRLGFVLAVALTMEVPAASSTEMALRELTREALAANPGYLAAVEQESEVRGGIVEARAAAFPEIEATGFWNRSRNPSLLNSSDFADIVEQFPGFRPSEQELFALAVELTQTLYSGGRVRAALRAAEVAVEIVEARVRRARLDLGVEVAEVYYGLLAAREALQTVEAQRQARERNLRVVEDWLEIGEATRLEALRAEASLAEVEPELANRRRDVELHETRLRSLLGRDRSEGLEVAAVDYLLADAPELASLLARARASRPELADLGLQLETFELRQRATRADGRPQVELEGRYGQTARLPENLAESLFGDWSINLSVRWSLFDGGRRRGQLDQLESQYRQLAFQIDEVEREIDLEIEDSWTAYRAARAAWRSAEVAARVAREARRVAVDSYEQGVALQLDVLDAQVQEAAADLRLIQAYYGALGEGARLARAVGAMPGDLDLFAATAAETGVGGK